MAGLSPVEIGQLVQAATQAAQAAADAAAALRASQERPQQKFTEASKVVRQPDPFGSDSGDSDSETSKFAEFAANFKAWLFYSDIRFEGDFQHIEWNVQNSIEVGGESPEVQVRRRQLYSILTGLLRGKPLRMILQISERNGFEAWRQLSQLYKPRTKSRSVSLLSALMNLPPFTKDRTLLEQVLGLERLRDEYRRSSGAEVPDDLMLSVLVKCLPGHIRQHIQLQLTETSTYAETRRAVVGYESVTASWAPSKIHMELGIVGSNSSSSEPPWKSILFQKVRAKERKENIGTPLERVRVVSLKAKGRQGFPR